MVRLRQMLQELDVSEDSEYRMGRRTALYHNKQLTEEYLAANHRADAMCSSRFAISFLLTHTESP